MLNNRKEKRNPSEPKKKKKNSKRVNSENVFRVVENFLSY